VKAVPAKKQSNDNDFAKFLDWMANTVRLEIYVEKLCSAGYSSMRTVAVLNESDLIRMGIDNAKHREFLMAEIEKLQ
jgi:hypothetical protein